MRKLNRACFAARRGFTLIELLVVVGILGILAVAALVAINPAEAQRKTRDAVRLKDVATLQSVLEQFHSDGGRISVNGYKYSSEDTNACTADGWLDIDVCTYIKTLPVDPVNKAGYFTYANGVAGGTTLRYRVYMNTSGYYQILTFLESKSNAAKLNGCLNATHGNYCFIIANL